MYGFLGSVRDYLFKPAEGDLFQINGQLSPNEFYRAGDHLTKVCAGWQWKPSLIPNYTSPCMKDKDKQFLMLEKVVCRRRLSTMMP